MDKTTRRMGPLQRWATPRMRVPRHSTRSTEAYVKIVQIGYKLSVGAMEYRPIAAAIAAGLAESPGLQRRMLFLNEDAGVAGGVCLFEDEISRDEFLSSELVAQLRGASFHRGLELKLFDLISDGTAAPGGAGQLANLSPQG